METAQVLGFRFFIAALTHSDRMIQRDLGQNVGRVPGSGRTSVFPKE